MLPRVEEGVDLPGAAWSRLRFSDNFATFLAGAIINYPLRRKVEMTHWSPWATVKMKHLLRKFRKLSTGTQHAFVMMKPFCCLPLVDEPSFDVPVAVFEGLPDGPAPTTESSLDFVCFLFVFTWGASSCGTASSDATGPESASP